MADFTPDLDQAARFLKILDPNADFRSLVDDYPDGFTFQTFDDIKSRKDRSLARVIHGPLSSVSSTLSSLNRSMAGVFVTINETDGAGRKLANMLRVRALWIEDDAGLGIKTPLEPHLISETSPGKFHKIFLADGLSPEQHQDLQKILVEQYGSDPSAKDLARVLRVPGFWHCKGSPYQVNLIHESGAKPYSAAELLDAFRYDPDAVITSQLPKGKTKSNQVTRGGVAEDGYRPLTGSEPLPDINASNAAQYLPPAGEQSYSEWRDIGMALHHQFSGSDEGLTIFDLWSQDVRNYNGFEDVAAYWSTFGKRMEGPEVTFRSLIQAHRLRKVEAQKTDLSSVQEKGLAQIEKCDDANLLLEDVAPRLWFMAKGNVSAEKAFTDALIKRYAVLKPGEKLLRSEALRALKKHRRKMETGAEAVVDLDDPRIPKWAHGWVWVAEEEHFFSVSMRSALTLTGFKNQFSSHVKELEGDSKDAVRYVLDNELIPKVIRSMYMPSCGTIFEFHGVECVNTCNTLHRAVVPDEVTNWDAVDIFRRHVENICGDWNREAQILCNWFAVAAGNPPRKIRWAPLLIGAVGDGKSVFNEFMLKALGDTNCKTISSSLIMSSAQTGQSGWAEGGSFGFIEELKWHGHNRYDAMNALKPYITNDVVPCRKLFKESITIPNTMNYFATSNYLDGAPLEEGDRRFYALQSKLNKENLEDDYFKKLFDAIREESGSILRWLLDLPWHKDFKPDGEAPMTETKREIINLVSDDVPTRIAEILEDDGAAEYCPEVILFDALYARVSNMFSNLPIDSPRKLSSILSGLGYTSLTRCWVGGSRHRIWVKRNADPPISIEEAKAFMEARIKDQESKVSE